MALLKVDEVKGQGNITVTDYDNILGNLAESIQSLFDKFTDRTFEASVLTEYYSTNENDSTLFLDNYPINSITSIHDDPDWSYGTDALINSSDYTYDSKKGIVYYNGGFYKGNNNIKIIYNAGYTYDNFPPAWREILTRQILYWFNQYKTNKIGILSLAQAGGGGSINVKTFDLELLPDFLALIEMES